MAHNAPGARHTAVATKACVHGQIVEEDGFVGTAFKVAQVDRFVRPADARDIAIGEEFEILVGGIHEANAAGAIAAAGVDDLIWIDPADNSLEVAVANGRLPVGVVTEVDLSRTPDVLKINGNALNAFLRGVAQA